MALTWLVSIPWVPQYTRPPVVLSTTDHVLLLCQELAGAGQGLGYQVSVTVQIVVVRIQSRQDTQTHPVYVWIGGGQTLILTCQQQHCSQRFRNYLLELKNMK